MTCAAFLLVATTAAVHAVGVPQDSASVLVASLVDEIKQEASSAAAAAYMYQEQQQQQQQQHAHLQLQTVPNNGRNLLQENEGVLCALAGGTLDRTGKCRRCPTDDSDRNCCTMNLRDFSMVCSVCERTTSGTEACGEYTCTTDIETENTQCSGCIDGDDGTVCSQFTCPPAAEGRCQCGEVKYNDQYCGPCSFDRSSYMVFDCAAVGGPVVMAPTPRPTPLPTAAPVPTKAPVEAQAQVPAVVPVVPAPTVPAGPPTTEEEGLCAAQGGILTDDQSQCKICVDRDGFFADVCPSCQGATTMPPDEGGDCSLFFCMDDYTTGYKTCLGCLGSSICLKYECPVGGDYAGPGCACREFNYNGRPCQSCTYGDTLEFDCTNVGGPKSAAASGFGVGVMGQPGYLAVLAVSNLLGGVLLAMSL